MGTVILREYRDFARGRDGRGGPSMLSRGELVTDGAGKAIKTVTTVLGTSVDSVPMSAQTKLVAIEPAVNVRYAVRPKKLRYTPLAATTQHAPIPAGQVVFEAVYPGAVISFLEIGAPVAPGVSNWIPGYVPVLGL